MPTLTAFQQEMKKLLFVGRHPTAQRLWSGKPPARLNVYRNNVRLNWFDTLNGDFPLTRRQFSDGQWRRLLETFCEQTPPAHWELNTSMKNFPTFLERRRDVRPWVADLARYEWTDLQTLLHRWPTPSKRNVVNPTLSVQPFRHQMFFWVKAEAPNHRPPEPKPEVLVFFRDRANRVRIEEADPLMLICLEEFKRPTPSLARMENAARKLLPNNQATLPAVVKNLKRREILL